VWEAAERLVAAHIDSPFWAFPWPAGTALAALVRERPGLVAGKSVIDVGAGGGVTCIACALSGARRVVGCDTDPWALAVTRIAARRQGLEIETCAADPTADPGLLDPFDIVLCGDLAYSRADAPRERAALRHAAERGGHVIVADAGRRYFDPDGFEEIARYVIQVVADVEGCDVREASIYRMRT
jgi:predicted nicotinamide N-methyase